MNDHLNIFLEYMDGGSLRRHLDRKGPMSENQTAAVTKEVLAGLSYLHSNGIAHRDIKVGTRALEVGQGWRVYRFVRESGRERLMGI